MTIVTVINDRMALFRAVRFLVKQAPMQHAQRLSGSTLPELRYPESCLANLKLRDLAGESTAPVHWPVIKKYDSKLKLPDARRLVKSARQRNLEFQDRSVCLPGELFVALKFGEHCRTSKPAWGALPRNSEEKKSLQSLKTFKRNSKETPKKLQRASKCQCIQSELVIRVLFQFRTHFMFDCLLQFSFNNASRCVHSRVLGLRNSGLNLRSPKIRCFPLGP